MSDDVTDAARYRWLKANGLGKQLAGQMGALYLDAFVDAEIAKVREAAERGGRDGE